MKFTKMQGCGNDYVYINCFEETVTDVNSFAARISDRHFGIGSDGLILIKPSTKADFIMEMYNSDGTQGKMCGNAIRCVGKYVWDHKMTNKTELRIETLGGIKTLFLNIGNDGLCGSARVDMGIASIKAADIPMITGKEDALDVKVTADGIEYTVTGVSVGNPHGVIFVDDVDSLDLEKIGPGLERNKAFPEMANIEFVQLVDEHTVKMRVYERCSGETWACGTGATVSAVSSVIHGYAKSPVTVNMRGGTLIIDYDENTKRAWMTGPAVTVFTGEINS